MTFMGEKLKCSKILVGSLGFLLGSWGICPALCTCGITILAYDIYGGKTQTFQNPGWFFGLFAGIMGYMSSVLYLHITILAYDIYGQKFKHSKILVGSFCFLLGSWGICQAFFSCNTTN